MKKRCLAMTVALMLLLTLSAAAAAESRDEAETVSFENLAAHMRGSSPMLLAYGEMIAAVDAVDRATAYEDLVQANNALSDVIWAYLQAGNTAAAWVLQEQQEQLREQLDAYKTDTFPKTYTDLVMPIHTLSNQLILGAERLYLKIAVLDLELERGSIELTKLERTVRETQLLQSLGRASVYACKETEAARDAASDQLDALITQSELWKAQLQFLLGQTPTGVLTLTGLPEVTETQLSALQYEADLKSGLESNLDLYLLEGAIADAKEEWEDAESGYQRKAAEHSYNAAVYAYEAKKQEFQQFFDAMYRGIESAQSAVSAVQGTFAYQQNVYTAAKLRYALGLIPKSILLTAEADLAIAELAMQTVRIDLFSAYNSYCWARRGLFTAQT